MNLPSTADSPNSKKVLWENDQALQRLWRGSLVKSRFSLAYFVRVNTHCTSPGAIRQVRSVSLASEIHTITLHTSCFFLSAQDLKTEKSRSTQIYGMNSCSTEGFCGDKWFLKSFSVVLKDTKYNCNVFMWCLQQS